MTHGQEKKGGFAVGYGLLPVTSHTIRMMIASISKMWIRKPIAGSKIQPNNQIKITIKAIQSRIDIVKT